MRAAAALLVLLGAHAAENPDAEEAGDPRDWAALEGALDQTVSDLAATGEARCSEPGADCGEEAAAGGLTNGLVGALAEVARLETDPAARDLTDLADAELEAQALQELLNAERSGDREHNKPDGDLGPDEPAADTDDDYRGVDGDYYDFLGGGPSSRHDVAAWTNDTASAAHRRLQSGGPPPPPTPRIPGVKFLGRAGNGGPGQGAWLQWDGLTCTNPRLSIRLRRVDYDWSGEYLTILSSSASNSANDNPVDVEDHADGQYWGATKTVSTGVPAMQYNCLLAPVFQDVDATSMIRGGMSGGGTLRIAFETQAYTNPLTCANDNYPRALTGWSPLSGEVHLAGCTYTSGTSNSDSGGTFLPARKTCHLQKFSLQ